MDSKDLVNELEEYSKSTEATFSTANWSRTIKVKSLQEAYNNEYFKEKMKRIRGEILAAGGNPKVTKEEYQKYAEAYYRKHPILGKGGSGDPRSNIIKDFKEINGLTVVVYGFNGITKNIKLEADAIWKRKGTGKFEAYRIAYIKIAKANLASGSTEATMLIDVEMPEDKKIAASSESLIDDLFTKVR